MINYDVIEEFARKKKRQVLIAILAVPFIVLRIFKSEIRQLDFLNDSIVSTALIALVIGMIAYSFINWRCPQCNAYLGKEISLKHCKQCGVQLVENA